MTKSDLARDSTGTRCGPSYGPKQLFRFCTLLLIASCSAAQSQILGPEVVEKHQRVLMAFALDPGREYFDTRDSYSFIAKNYAYRVEIRKDDEQVDALIVELRRSRQSVREGGEVISPVILIQIVDATRTSEFITDGCLVEERGSAEVFKASAKLRKSVDRLVFGGKKVLGGVRCR